MEANRKKKRKNRHRKKRVQETLFGVDYIVKYYDIFFTEIK